MGNLDFPDWVRFEVLILRRTCTILRKIFFRRWKLSESTDWSNCHEFGQRFVGGLGAGIYKTCGRLRRMTLEEGDTNNWDFCLLIRVLREAEFKVPDEMINEVAHENQRLQQLATYQSHATRHQRKTMNDDEFSQYWNEIANILISFGDSEKQLEELKSCTSISEDVLMYRRSLQTGNGDQSSEENISLAQRLKDEAKSAMHSSQPESVDHALDCLTRAVSLDNLPEVELAVLYTYRCDVFLRKAASSTSNMEGQNRLTYLALKDAKYALHLRPVWGLVHYRVGTAYVQLGKYKKATKFLDQALDLEPSMEEIKKDRKTCNLRLIELERERASSSSGLGSSRGTTPEGFDDFDPTTRTFALGLQPKSYLAGATRLSPLVQSSLDKVFLFDFDEPSNLLADVYRAHKLRDGLHIEQNYKNAAQIYRKHTKSQNAEAMYNLALLKLHGHGVKHDPAGAIELLKQAAKQPHKLCRDFGSNFVSNVGVGESEFLLGLLHYMGYGFKQRDAFSAAHWYADAIGHGNGPAAHNLAILHWYGKGIVKDEEKAVQLWKLASSRGVLHSMIALAIYCLKNWQTEQARSWMATANNTTDPLHDTGEFPLTVEEQELMHEVMHRIDLWKSKYTIASINSWELEVGMSHKRNCQSVSNKNKTTGVLSLKSRIMRMLQTLEHEKECIKKVNEYLDSIKPKPVIIEFPNFGQCNEYSKEANNPSGGLHNPFEINDGIPKDKLSSSVDHNGGESGIEN